eukprot:MONOS_4419.1-p1 / transcript=MONOS_4419.1 / gene=MONOS_4419 / organism=Monocercomonoides_exilis_PA203 / gene_product=unspecified product / transcript_product=unspecified product / location=Mono_scaffold00117:84891-85528(-) / protein_length=189 / sequence_SO=supercontig / SO=protein_coding / is_pseudo=false
MESNDYYDLSSLDKTNSPSPLLSGYEFGIQGEDETRLMDLLYDLSLSKKDRNIVRCAVAQELISRCCKELDNDEDEADRAMDHLTDILEEEIAANEEQQIIEESLENPSAQNSCCTSVKNESSSFQTANNKLSNMIKVIFAFLLLACIFLTVLLIGKKASRHINSFSSDPIFEVFQSSSIKKSNSHPS